MTITYNGATVTVALNPLTKIAEDLTEVKETVQGAVNGVRRVGDFLGKLDFWTNPDNLFPAIRNAFTSGGLETPLLAFTLIGVILWMLGAEWPKKYVYWANIAYWGLKLFVFVV